MSHRYLVIFEKGPNNYSAYSPDLPGCIATGPTREATRANMREAIEFHLEGLREGGLPIPPGHSADELPAEVVEVP